MNHELSFWKRFIHTDQFAGWKADIITPELDEQVVELFQQNKGASVVDVGSGVVSVLNGLDLQITPVDPLADDYARIFDYEKEGFQKPVCSPGESLPFQNKSFDFGHIRNAIDHSEDPMECLLELVRVSRRAVIVQGFENEGIHERYQGFHQWNMSLNGNELIFSSRNGVHFSMGGHRSYQKRLSTGRTWIVWILSIG